jgi:glycosyltransferase involved in cell wall biosynthesis
VIDDGSEDDTAQYLRSIDDARVKRLTAPGAGACAARNVGLEAAHGDVIAYLDDDNLYDRHWLKAVAMTFRLKPSARVVYGVRVYDDSGRLLGAAPSGRAGFQFARWDRDAARNYNTVDTSVIAHRRSEARFDEELETLGDWDMLLQLVADNEPVEIPAIAAYYRTDSPGRLSTTSPAEQLVRDYDRVRRKATAEAAALER